MNDPVPTTEKLPLEKIYNEKLKLFLFITRSQQYPALPEEQVRAVISYRLDEATQNAVNETRTQYNPRPWNVIFTGNYIQLDSLLINVPPVEEKPLVILPAPMTKTQFIYNLQLAADEFVKNKKDKELLKGIIEKIKCPILDPIKN